MESHQLVNQSSVLIGGLPAQEHRTVSVDASILALGGIYVIRNTVNGKLYVGSTAWFRRRFKDHRKGLRQGNHHCVPLMRAWEKYGGSAFVFEITEVVTDLTQETLLAREQEYLDRYLPRQLYNVCRIAASQLGMKRSEAVRERMRRGAKDRKRPPLRTQEHRDNLSRSNTGKIRSPETCEKLRRANLGKKLSPEHCRKISEGRLGIGGWKHTEETKRRMSLAQRGRQPTPETRAKMRAAKLGTKRSAESLAKQSASLMGHRHSDETRVKLRATALRREASKRALRTSP